MITDKTIIVLPDDEYNRALLYNGSSHGPQTASAFEENCLVVCNSAKSGGPCRGRTYGPLIKSERQGMTQVVEDLGHPLVIPADHPSWLLTLSA